MALGALTEVVHLMEERLHSEEYMRATLVVLITYEIHDLSAFGFQSICNIISNLVIIAELIHQASTYSNIPIM